MVVITGAGVGEVGEDIVEEDVETRDKIVKAVNADEGLRQNVDKLEQFLAWPKR